MPDPFRLNLEVLAACASADDAAELLEAMQEHLPPNTVLELATVEPMDHRDVIEDSPLAALLYGDEVQADSG